MRQLLEPGYRLLTGLVAAALTLLLSPSLPEHTRVVLAWNIGVTVLLGLIAVMMWRSDAQETRRRARKEETSNVVVLLVTVVTVIGALAFISSGLPKANSMSHTLRVFHICQSVAGVLLAWLMMHIMYSLHYAKLYYGNMNDADENVFRKGLVFPGDNDVVDYWDFVYYALTIAMCFQTSDITITSPYVRRLTIVHATVSYFFAFVILGLLLGEIIANII
jgi:uncharacterized membrane protein